MYKALEVEFIIIRKMLIMINGNNKKDAKHESVRIKRIVLDWNEVIITSLLIQRGLFSLNMNNLFYLKLKTGKDMIQNMEAICWAQSTTMFRILQMFERPLFLVICHRRLTSTYMYICIYIE